MKIIILAPGLGTIKRGYERFALEMSATLRENGLDAVCWGTSPAPGVEALPTAGRNELLKNSLERLHHDSAFRDLPSENLQAWSVQAEDQFFAIPAAFRLQELLKDQEPVLIYAKWQGGLVDPNAGPTPFLESIATASRQGKARLLVHTDFVAPYIFRILGGVGARFHIVAPGWESAFRQIGIPLDSATELPMAVRATPLRDAIRFRSRVREDLGIPQDAPVILSVGSFDSTTPDKRHRHVLEEILVLPRAEETWWVVAGSRSGGPTAWEQEAQRRMGRRFIPLMNLPFEKMPELYGIADLFVLGSLKETFGLVFVEAQMAGLPCVIHDAGPGRNICSELEDRFCRLTLVDMTRQGTASQSMSRWLRLLRTAESRAATRDALQAFAIRQQIRFGWESLGPKYAEMFRRCFQDRGSSSPGQPASPPVKQTSAPARGAAEAGEESEADKYHRLAVKAWKRGEDEGAVRMMGKLLGSQETAAYWTTWARMMDSFHRPAEVESGLRRALELDPQHIQAAAELGLLLAGQHRDEEALHYLEGILTCVDESLRRTATQVVENCRLAVSGKPGSAAIRSGLDKRLGEETNDGFRFARLSHYTRALSLLPTGGNGKRLLILGKASEVLAPVAQELLGFEVFTLAACQAKASAGELQATTDGAPNAASIGLKTHLVDTRWSFADGFFDVVLSCEFLEFLSIDPMAQISELNRVLKMGGQWLMSTPNLISSKSLQAILLADSPYVASKFSEQPDGTQTGGREYGPREIQSIMKAAGFSIQLIRSEDFYWARRPQFLGTLASGIFSVGLRGDTLLVQAVKGGSVSDRYPARLYVHSSRKDSTGKRPLRICVVNEGIPCPNQGGADKRLWQVLERLRELGHAVTMVGMREPEKWHATADLEAMGIEVRAADSEALRFEWSGCHTGYTFDQVLRDGQFDVVLICVWLWHGIAAPEHYMDEVRKHSPGARIAILTDDCHWLRHLRVAEINGRWSDLERSTSLLARETEIYNRADLVISISEDDIKCLRKQFKDIRLCFLPMCCEPGSMGPGFESREGLVYMADYRNPASLDAIEWFLAEVWQRILYRLPKLKLYLVGNGMPAGLGERVPNIVRVGHVPDLGPEFGKYRVFISPVRWGTGIKTKNLHALSQGLPLVTTTVGAEGMYLKNGDTAFIADTAEEFSRAVLKVYGNPQLWQEVAKAGHEHVKTVFSKENMRVRTDEVLKLAVEQSPLPYEPEHVWSTRLVDRHFPELLTRPAPGKEREMRIVGHSRLAEKLLASGDKVEARRQVSHIFSIVNSTVGADQFYKNMATVVDRMDRVYRDLGEPEAAQSMRAEANGKPHLPVSAPGPPAKNSSRRSKSSTRPALSVVIPTYNRQVVLKEALFALRNQTLPAGRFEVIVVNDGSSDATEDFCRNFQAPFAFDYLSQENAGTGAARRLGAEKARGDYLLLMNDDTIASPDLLDRHLAAHRREGNGKVAVLGNFEYPPAARSRALTYYLSVRPFLFPMMNMKAGRYDQPALFVTCNLSVPRRAVLQAGSFDPKLRVGEDTDLGIRLFQRGFQIVYEPQAQAIHQHLDFQAEDLVRRAKTYARAQFYLIQKHPVMLGDGSTPFGHMDSESAQNLRNLVEKHRVNAPQALRTLRQFDGIDFEQFWRIPSGQRSMAEEIVDLFSIAVPEVYFHFFYEAFLDVWKADASFPLVQLMEEAPQPLLAG